MRILVVDDETIILQNVVRGIEMRGHQVVGTSSAQEALNEYKAEPTFDWVLTDFQMPGKRGDWLCEEIKDINHNQKILVQTGDAVFARRCLSRSEHPLVREIRVIAKPYSFKELSLVMGLESTVKEWRG